MVKVIVQHHVADYERWYPVFIEHSTVRRNHGAQGHTIYRGAKDPNDLLVVNSFASADGAQSFMADPSMKEALDRAGVDSQPQIWVMTEADSQDY
jgi:quinol monooxygenase YgiN